MSLRFLHAPIACALWASACGSESDLPGYWAHRALLDSLAQRARACPQVTAACACPDPLPDGFDRCAVADSGRLELFAWSKRDHCAGLAFVYAPAWRPRFPRDERIGGWWADGTYLGGWYVHGVVMPLPGGWHRVGVTPCLD
jgi:hypothetical protein